MLNINSFKSGVGTLKYYETSLSSGDYYTQEDSQELVGNWGGKLAEEIGLKGKVSKLEFAKLINNINPKTGKKMSVQNRENRRTGYDLTFNAPKSLSIMQSIGKDKELLKVFREAVVETMEEVEARMQVRVRKGQKNLDKDKLSRNMAWAEFVHFTGRPVGGLPDMHLHSHIFAINATKDKEDGKIKAGQFGEIVKHKVLLTAIFHAKLMQKVQDRGYEIDLKPKSWEIKGVSKSMIQRFSKRTNQIEKMAKEMEGIDAKTKGELGATTREKKKPKLSRTELEGVWDMQATIAERENLKKIKQQKEQNLKNKTRQWEKTSPNQALSLAFDDLLERQSLALEKHLLQKGLHYGKGSFHLQDLKDSLSNNLQTQKLFKFKLTDDKTYYTQSQVFKEEQELLNLVAYSKGRYKPLLDQESYKEAKDLNQEQNQAVKFLLNSKDGVTSIRGGAGTGKTRMMTEAIKRIKAKNKEVLTLAPSATASRGVLREEGFEEADTIAKFLETKSMQKKAKNQIIWIDEAGLLSIPQLKQILETAKKNKARVILSGDTNQHSGVERGEALKLLEDFSKLSQSQLSQIQRQTNPEYRDIIQTMEKGDFENAIGKLIDGGMIREIQNDEDRYSTLAKEYTNLIQDNKKVLIVSPTHKEGKKATEYIRKELKQRNLLTKEEEDFLILKSKNLTEVERQPEFLEHTDIIRFYKDYKGFKKGVKYKLADVKQEAKNMRNGENENEKENRGNKGWNNKKRFLVEIEEKSNQVERRGKQEENTKTVEQNKLKLQLPKESPKYYNVFNESKIPLAIGEQIQITQNGQDKKKQELMNGQSLIVTDYKDGIIQAKDKQGKTFELDNNFQDFKHSYYSTSHSSQGKTADHVIIAQGKESLPASSPRQIYVASSRGREGIRIYTQEGVLEEVLDRKQVELSVMQVKRLSRKRKRESKEVEEKTNMKLEIEKPRQAENTPKNQTNQKPKTKVKVKLKKDLKNKQNLQKIKNSLQHFNPLKNNMLGNTQTTSNNTNYKAKGFNPTAELNPSQNVQPTSKFQSQNKSSKNRIEQLNQKLEDIRAGKYNQRQTTDLEKENNQYTKTPTTIKPIIKKRENETIRKEAELNPDKQNKQNNKPKPIQALTKVEIWQKMIEDMKNNNPFKGHKPSQSKEIEMEK